MGCWETPVFNSSQVAWNLNLKFHSTGTVVYGSRVLPDNQAPSNRGWAELEFFATEWVAWWEKCQGTPFYILPMYLLRGVLIQWYHTRWGIWITNKWYTFIQLSLCQIQSCPLFYCPKKLSSRSISNCNSNVFTILCTAAQGYTLEYLITVHMYARVFLFIFTTLYGKIKRSHSIHTAIIQIDTFKP